MTAAVERMLPLYEAKMIHHFDHRWATYGPAGSIRDVTEEEKQDPTFVVLPRYWVREEVVADRLGVGVPDRLHGYRWVARSTDERTLIASSLPKAAAGNSLPVLHQGRRQAALIALMSTFTCDYVARQKLGGANMTYGTLHQIAVPAPKALEGACPWYPPKSTYEWLCGALDALGWDDLVQRESVLRSLDAAVAHLYGLPEEDLDYILETFLIVKRKDEREHGEFRTKRLILDAYAAMQCAIETGVPYRSPWDSGSLG